MSKIKKLAGETVIYGIGGILPRVVNFLLVASYLTFQLSKDVYGIHGILYSFATLALVLFTLRMETTYFKFAADKSNDSQHVFNATLTLVLASSTALFAIMLIFNKSIAALLTTPEDFRYVIYFAIILFLDAVSAIPFGKLRLESRPVKFTFIKVMNSLITVSLIVICFNVFPLIESLSFIYQKKYFLDFIFIANIIGSLFIVLMLIHEYRGFKITWDSDLGKKMLQFAWPLIIVGIAGSINQFSDRIFISYLTAASGEEQNFDTAGLFTGAIKIAVIMNLFVTAFNYAVEPFFFKNADVNSRKSMYGSIALAFTICATIIFMSVMFYLDIFKYMIDESYHEGLYIVPVALLANLLLGLYYNFSIWFKLSGKTIYGALIASVGAIVFITLNLILIPKIGIVGASFGSLFCFLTMTAMSYLLGRRHYPIYYPIVRMTAYLITGIIAVYGMKTLELSTTNNILVGTIVLVIYATIAYFMDLKKLIKL